MTAAAHGLVIGKFYPPHSGHHLLIDTAAAQCARVSVVVMAASQESIPLATRVQWLRAVHAHQPRVTVTGIMDDLPMNLQDAAVWRAHVDLMHEALAGIGAPPVTAVFSSESYGAELARHFDALPVTLDLARGLAPISATRFRADPVAHWDFIAPAVRAGLARRIVVIGAESTGTTTLSLALLDHLRARGGALGATRWVEEYGRRYTIEKLARERAAAQLAHRPEPAMESLQWHSAEFLEIARVQCALAAQEAALGGPLLVCDTDAFATSTWHERYVGKPSPEVEALAETDRGALYLLTRHEDVPFEQDGIRDGESIRAWMTQRFVDRLAETGRRTVVLHGNREERLARAVAAVDDVLAEGWNFAPPLPDQTP
jgi:HTH-type transcriptional repressor of NAD biosynthesis genes